MAPCGTWETLRAAIAGGADAVYFGLEDFNARSRAENFTLHELPDVMDFLRNQNARGYVALNTLAFPDELPRLEEFVAGIARAGADAVIVQDLGLMQLVREVSPTLPIHASTQATQTNAPGLAALRELGVSRVILARELSMEQIASIVAADTMDVEVFVHGALCISYSGQCLASESLMGRSANRGQCAQACRLPYQLVVDGEVVQSERQYLLSPLDLLAINQIGKLTEAGVRAFKIEGRLKNAAYVAATARAYRLAIDHACSGSSQPFVLPPAQKRHLDGTFSRGPTHGFLKGSNRELVEGTSPTRRGQLMGTTRALRNTQVLVELADDVNPQDIQPGDGVLFENVGGAPNIGGRVYTVTAPAGRGSPGTRPVVLLTFARELEISAIRPGSVMWKTDDPKLRKELEDLKKLDKVAKPIELLATLAGSVGGPLKLTLKSAAGEASADWPGPLEAATRQPLTCELASKQIGRLGGTPFALKQVNLVEGGKAALSLNFVAPASVLNELRRQAVASLVEQLSGSARRGVRAGALERLSTSRPSAHEQAQPTLHLLVRTIEQLKTMLGQQDMLIDIGTIYGDFYTVEEYRQAAELATAAQVNFAPALSRIMKPGEEDLQEQILGLAKRVLVRNIGSLKMLQGRDLEITGDYSLNAANELTTNYLLSQGVCRVVPSYDLAWSQLESMLAGCDAGSMEIVLHHHMPMFHMQHCLWAANLSSKRTTCGNECKQRLGLQDRNAEVHTVLRDIACRNTVYNSHAQSACHFFENMVAAGLRHFRIELLEETPEQMLRLLEIYIRLLHDSDGRSAWLQLKEQMPVTRGTWIAQEPRPEHNNS